MYSSCLRRIDSRPSMFPYLSTSFRTVLHLISFWFRCCKRDICKGKVNTTLEDIVLLQKWSMAQHHGSPACLCPIALPQVASSNGRGSKPSKSLAHWSTAARKTGSLPYNSLPMLTYLWAVMSEQWLEVHQPLPLRICPFEVKKHVRTSGRKIPVSPSNKNWDKQHPVLAGDLQGGVSKKILFKAFNAAHTDDMVICSFEYSWIGSLSLYTQPPPSPSSPTTFKQGAVILDLASFFFLETGGILHWKSWNL